MALHGVLLKKNSINRRKKKFCTLFGQQQKFDWQKKKLDIRWIADQFFTTKKKSRWMCDMVKKNLAACNILYM